MKTLNNLMSFLIAGAVATTYFIFASCGDIDVESNELIASPEDYEGKRIRLAGEISYIFEDSHNNSKVRLQIYDGCTGGYWGYWRETNDCAFIYCYFDADQPLPAYIQNDDQIAISGIVRIESDGEPTLIECRVIE